ncbi:hypothetical protein DICA2_E05798 [Diutina catenulata]
MKQEPFLVEQFMDEFETAVEYNMGETCVHSLLLRDLLDEEDFHELASARLTYGHIRGSPLLRSEISELYCSVSSDDIVVTNGAIGANFLGFYSTLTPEDSVVVITPTYQQLTSVPSMFGARVTEYKLSFSQGWMPDIEELDKLLEEVDASMLVINNPNNPTGVVWDDQTMKCIVELVQRRGVLLFSDEVYRPLYHNLDEARAPKSAIDYGYEKVIVSGSMSKAFSLAGIRVGWLATRSQNMIKNIWEKRDYNTIAVSMIDDFVATKALSCREKIMKRNYAICRENLALVSDFVASQERLSWVSPSGGSTSFISVRGVNTSELCRKLALEFATLLVPGEVFGFPGFVRLGFGNSKEDIINGLFRLASALKD